MVINQSLHANAAKRSHGFMLLLALSASSSLASQSLDPAQKASTTMADTGIEQVIERNVDSIMTLPDVVAVSESLCNKQLCIKILLGAENADTRARLPEQIEGIPVVIEVSGQFFASPK
jgi:hypothetical protein